MNFAKLLCYTASEEINKPSRTETDEVVGKCRFEEYAICQLLGATNDIFNIFKFVFYFFYDVQT